MFASYTISHNSTRTLATFCVYLFDVCVLFSYGVSRLTVVQSKLNDSLGVLVLRVACSVAGALGKSSSMSLYIASYTFSQCLP